MKAWYKSIFRSAPAKPVYRPNVRPVSDGRYEQVFTASFVSLAVADGVVTIGLTESESAPVHGLIISLPQREAFSPSEIYVEFNDQANGCTGSQVKLSLVGARLIVEYDADVEVWAGRISYASEADPLCEPDDGYEHRLSRVAVDLHISPESFQRLTHQLDTLLKRT